MQVNHPPAYVIDEVMRFVRDSDRSRPGVCRKSFRIAVIFRTEIVVIAENGTPYPYACSGDDACKAACNKICIHAEEHALLLVASDGRAVGADMLHAKVVDGQIVPSGPPSCWQCSRKIVACGIEGMWLLHEHGWRRYAAHEFHEATLLHHNLPTKKLGDEMTKPTGLRVEYYKDAVGLYRWTQYAENGKIRDSSSEGFHDLDAARDNWEERIDEAQEIKASDRVFVRNAIGDREHLQARSKS